MGYAGLITIRPVTIRPVTVRTVTAGSGVDVEIETEDRAVDAGRFDGVQTFDAGSRIVDAVGDLLALKEEESSDDQSDDEDEGSGECAGNDPEQQQSDDHGNHRSGKRCVASLGNIQSEREDRDEIAHGVRLL